MNSSTSSVANSSMETNSELMQLPGFRFHPTEEDLLDFYLRNAVHRNKPDVDIITVLNIYLYDPWDLPAMAKMGEREWYFYVPRDHKPGNSCRPNRTTNRGFWKATGSDRQIRSTSDSKRLLGLKKTLVFYEGRAPQGTRTDWIMNEYRLTSATKEDVVLCKVYRKATSMKALEKRAAEMDEKKRVQLEVVVPERNLNWLAWEWDDQQLKSPWMEYWSPYADLFCF